MSSSADLKRRKRALRRDVLAARDGLEETFRAEASERIARTLLSMREIATAHAVLAYASFRTEVETGTLGAGLVEGGATVALPRIEGGVPEPVGRDTVDAESIDIVIVPGVAFDTRGGRLGYGGGYYDRFLARHPRALRIALAFEAQVVHEVPRGAHDLGIDVLVTEERSMTFSGPADRVRG